MAQQFIFQPLGWSNEEKRIKLTGHGDVGETLLRKNTKNIYDFQKKTNRLTSVNRHKTESDQNHDDYKVFIDCYR